jgi:hypothetical protein
MVQMTSQYFDFEPARDITKRSWDSRANNNYNGMPMLEYFIQQSHAKGIQVHAWSSINIVNNVNDAEYRLFGPSAGYLYNTVIQTESGTTSWLFHTNGTGTFSTVSPGYEGSNTAQLRYCVQEPDHMGWTLRLGYRKKYERPGNRI